MKLNKDLIREILLYIEENGNGKIPKDKIEIFGYIQDEIYYHFKRLIEAGFVNGEIKGLQSNRLVYWDLTWVGHEYLENIKDISVWTEIKRKIEFDGLKSLSLEILKDLSVIVIKNRLGI